MHTLKYLEAVGIMIREEEIVKLLSDLLTPEQVETAVPLSSLTTMRVGGPADVVVNPYGKDEVIKVLRLLAQEAVPYTVLGHGSNVIASDIGYDGVIVRMSGNMQRIIVQGNVITAEAGASMSSISRIAAAKGLSGLEFASGIPGVLGGALFMNAGAYGKEMKDIVQEVEILEMTGKIVKLSVDQMDFGYRHSILQSKSWIVLGATLKLEEGDPDQILAKMKELNEQRRSKQPLDMPSAGSVFKRPEGHFAGALIEEAGLKGRRIGGAMVSEKHAGFIVNAGDATCKDVMRLIQEVQRVVKEKTGVELEPELQYLTTGGIAIL